MAMIACHEHWCCCQVQIAYQCHTQAGSNRNLLSATMLGIVKAHGSYLESIRASIDNQVEFDKTRATHKDQVVKSIQALGESALELSDASDTLDYVRTSAWSAAEKDAITSTVNMRMTEQGGSSSTPTTQRTVLRPQEHLYIQNYFSESEWNKLRNSQINIGSKVDVLVSKGCEIGLYSLSEKTARALSATLIVAHGSSCDHSQAYEITQYIKEGFKKLRARRAIDERPSFDRFPESVDAFLKSVPGAFKGEGNQPIVCPIDVNMIVQLREAMPCRKTHNTLKQTPLLNMGSSASQSNASVGRSSSKLEEFLVPLAQALMANNASNRRLCLENSSIEPSASAGPALGAAPVLALTDLAPRDNSLGHTPSKPASAGNLGEVLVAGGSDSPEQAIVDKPESKSMASAIDLIQKAIKEKSSGMPPNDADDAEAAPKGKAKAGGKGTKTTGGPSKVIKLMKKPSGTCMSASSVSTKRPPMPPLKKVPPMHYLSCTIYCDQKHGQWRAVAASNRRKDVRFAWKGGVDEWNRCMRWCETHS